MTDHRFSILYELEANDRGYTATMGRAGRTADRFAQSAGGSREPLGALGNALRAVAAEAERAAQRLDDACRTGGQSAAGIARGARRAGDEMGRFTRDGVRGLVQ